MYLLRRPILALSANTAVRDVLVKAPGTRSVVNRFIPGATAAQAIDAVRRTRGEGAEVTLDYLGEDTISEADARATVDAYLELLTELDRVDLVTGAEVSVKLSAVGQGLPGGSDLAYRNLHEIASRAYGLGARVNVDMEDHRTVDSTLSILQRVRVDFPDTAVAIQAMLRRTELDLADLTGAGSRVRLVKGAYNEPASVAYQTAAEIDLAYVRALKILMAGQGYPMVATHDERLITIAGELAERHGRGCETYEYQMLYGIRTDKQRELAQGGNTIRIYLPYGSDWYGYFVRRLAERPANLLFFGRAVIGR